MLQYVVNDHHVYSNLSAIESVDPHEDDMKGHKQWGVRSASSFFFFFFFWMTQYKSTLNGLLLPYT